MIVETDAGLTITVVEDGLVCTLTDPLECREYLRWDDDVARHVIACPRWGTFYTSVYETAGGRSLTQSELDLHAYRYTQKHGDSNMSYCNARVYEIMELKCRVGVGLHLNDDLCRFISALADSSFWDASVDDLDYCPRTIVSKDARVDISQRYTEGSDELTLALCCFETRK